MKKKDMAKTTDSLILPQGLLDMLMQRVCLKIGNLACQLYAPNVWQWESAMCQRIEQDQGSTSSVVLETIKAFRDKAVSPDVVLTRIYLLLFYRHGTTQIYEDIVYPTLMEHMGSYADRRYEINDRVKSVSMRWGMLEDPASGTKRLFQRKQDTGEYTIFFPILSRYQAYEMLDNFNDEQLFRMLTPLMTSAVAKTIGPDDEIFRIHVWEDAKKLFTHWHPLDHNFLYPSLSEKGKNLSTFMYFMIHLCCYAMMLAADDKKGAGRVMKHIERRYFNEHWDAAYQARELVIKVNELLAQKPPSDNRDHQTDPATNPEPPQQPTTDNQSDNQKVRMELACRLLDKAGITEAVLEDHHGNKERAARILEKLLGIPFTTCKRYLSERDLSKTYHRKAIDQLNQLLSELGSDIRLDDHAPTKL